MSPSTAARGQRITIAGSGFIRALGGQNDFSHVSIDGIPMTDLTGYEMGTDGDFTLTATVPLDVRNGFIEVRVVSWDYSVAEAILTVPEPTMAIEPAQSGRGTEVDVTGSGFVVNRAALISYGDGVNLEIGDDTVGVAAADAEGRISGSFTVPLLAAIGKTHTVTAVSILDDEGLPFVIKADADHVPVDVTLAISPETVSSGDLVTIRGENFPTFTLVSFIRIGGIGAAARSDVNTDENGAFEAEVLVPHLELGDHVLRVQVGREIATRAIKIVPPPLSGSPADVFKDLIRDGVLARIWYLDSASQGWTFFDPSPDFADFSTLTSVQRGNILWVHLYAPRVFQGDQLVGAWNYIALQ